MSYFEESKLAGEHIVYKASYHWFSVLWAILLIIVGVGLIMLLKIGTTDMIVTNRRLLYKRGIISRVVEEI